MKETSLFLQALHQQSQKLVKPGLTVITEKFMFTTMGIGLKLALLQ
jgi:hypothetical protein